MEEKLQPKRVLKENNLQNEGGEHLQNEVKIQKDFSQKAREEVKAEGTVRAVPSDHHRETERIPSVFSADRSGRREHQNAAGKEEKFGESSYIKREDYGSTHTGEIHSEKPSQTFQTKPHREEIPTGTPQKTDVKSPDLPKPDDALIGTGRRAAATQEAKESTLLGGLSTDADKIIGSDKPETFTHMEQKVGYQHVPDGVKSTIESIFSKPAEAVKSQADFMAEERSEGYDRTVQKTKELSSIAGTIANASRRNEIIDALNKESRLYTAGDIFFKDGITEGAVSTYVKEAEKLGVYRGYTEGVHAAFLDVIKNPERYFSEGTTYLNEERVLKTIKENEVFKRDELGGIVKNQDGKPLYQVRQNQKMRKAADKAFKYKDINNLEAKMSSMIGSGIFNPAEEKLLSSNNNIFRFKSLGDIEKTQQIVDKYLLNKIKLAGTETGDVIKIGTKGLFDTELKELTLPKLKGMTSKDIKNLIGKLEGVKGAEEIVDILKAKHMLSMSSHKIRKLGSFASVGKTGFMMVAGDELMESDFGQSIGYVNRGVKTAKTAYNLGSTTVGFGKTAVVKAADLIAPDLMNEYRAVKQAKAKAKAEKIRNLSEKINKLKPVSKFKTTQKEVQEKIGRVTSKIGESLFGRLGKRAGTAVKTVFRVAAKPIQLASQATSFVTKKILMPIAVILGLMMTLFYIIMSVGGGGGGAASSVVTNIQSDEEQMLGGVDENGNQIEGYQQRYDAQDAIFQSQVNGVINGYAQTRNLRGEQIGYGINFAGLSENGITLPAIYQNGVTLKYFYDGSERDGISSNIEDCLSAMAVIMQQSQSEHHAEALDLITALYKSTHSYTTSETALYPSETGTSITQYFCNEWQGAADGSPAYWSTDMKYNPWIFGEMHKPSESDECPVCKQDGLPYHEYTGCEYLKTCYHADLGRSHAGCDNYHAVYDCPGHDHTDSEGNTTTSHCSGTLGCQGYYECDGHTHKYCPGHYVATDYGHVDLKMDINIASLNRIFGMGGVPVVESTTTNTSENQEENLTEGETGGESGE